MEWCIINFSAENVAYITYSIMNAAFNNLIVKLCITIRLILKSILL